jgi:thiol-disulfide isomerase/thioredoxin
MKKIFVILAFCLVLFSCQKENDFVNLTAKFENLASDSITLSDMNNNLVKLFVIKNKGEFKDTLNLKSGIYILGDSNEFAYLYLKNGMDLSLNIDVRNFDESIKFSGDGSDENNYLAKKKLEDKKYDFAGLLKNDKKTFNEKVNELEEKAIKDVKAKDFDEEFITIYTKVIKDNLEGLKKYYEENLKLFDANGTIALDFDYENYKGGTTKLSSLKGKYVYIDIWATWCGPCLQEIPFLQEIEKKFHNKNIEFVSISVDEQDQKDKWKTMVSLKGMNGVQLIADKSWESQFVASLGINSIPRFVLIDPTGKIINSNAPRPSDPELVKLLNSL